MGYSKEQILADIHTGSTVPEKDSKITKKSDEKKLSKKQLELQNSDNNLPEEQYNAAKAFYEIACPILNIDQKKHPFNARNPVDQMTTEDSNALGGLSEAKNKDLPTEADFKYKNEVIKALSKDLVFACETYDFLVEKNNKGDLTNILRSLNHISRFNNKKGNVFDYNIISKGENQKKFEDLKKCFKKDCESFVNKPLADDVFTGAKKELVNAFIDLMNKSLTFKSKEIPTILMDGKVTETGDININIKKFKIPADIADKEMEKSAKAATNQSGIGNFLKSILSNVSMNLRRENSISDVAIRMREALDPLQLYAAGVFGDDVNVDIDYADVGAVKMAKDLLEPHAANIELEHQTDHQKELDIRDYNLIKKIGSYLKNPEDVKTLLDTGFVNSIKLEDVFNTLSRRMYIQSKCKTALTDWDEKAGDLLFYQVPAFQNWMGTDYADRPNDEQDQEDLKDNLSDINSELEEKKNMAATMPDFTDDADKEQWISEHTDLIPFMSPQQLMYTKYALPMGVKDKPKKDEQQPEQSPEQEGQVDTTQLKNKNDKRSARNVKGEVNISNTNQNQAIIQQAQQNESISDVANELLRFLN